MKLLPKIQGGFFDWSARKMTSDAKNFFDGIYYVIRHLVIFKGRLVNHPVEYKGAAPGSQRNSSTTRALLHQSHHSPTGPAACDKKTISLPETVSECFFSISLRLPVSKFSALHVPPTLP